MKATGTFSQHVRAVADLEREIARLQEQVTETRRKWDITLNACQKAELEYDGWEALAEVRGEALGKTKCLHNPNYPCITSLKDCPAEWCLRCRAIAMTPEEALAKED